MECDVLVYEVDKVSEELVAAVSNLLSQLTSSDVVFTTNELRAIVESPASSLFVAEHNGAVCGMLTLAWYVVPTGRKIWVEDVVVDVAVRGKSIGKTLMTEALAKAKELGGTLMLTSRPSRVAANALYRSVGFDLKQTNVYKMKM